MARAGQGSCELGHLIVDRAAALLGRAPSFAELVAAYRDAVDWAVTAVDDGTAALAAAR